MPIYNKDFSLIISSMDSLRQIYGVKLTTSNQWGSVGDLVIYKDTKISVICDDTGKNYSIRFKTLKGKLGGSIDFTKPIICSGRAAHYTKLMSGSYSNIVDKMVETRMTKYGTRGIPFTDQRRRVASENKIAMYKTKKGKDVIKKISEKAKERLKNKENHPVFGRSMSDTSKAKNRESQYRYMDKNGLSSNGCGRYKFGYFFSNKNNKEIRYRSSYEMTMYLLLEFSNDVLYYNVEPFFINYLYEGINRRYYPDVLVAYSNKTHLIEVKPNNKYMRNEPKNLAKFNAGYKYAEENNMEYLILDRSQMLRYIFSNINSFNTKFISRLTKVIDRETFGDLAE